MMMASRSQRLQAQGEQVARRMKRPAAHQWEESPAKSAASASGSGERPHKYELPQPAERSRPSVATTNGLRVQARKLRRNRVLLILFEHGPLVKAIKRKNARVRAAAAERLMRKRDFPEPSPSACRERKSKDNMWRINAICKVTMPGEKGVEFKAGFDYEDDEAVDFYCRRAGGFWGKRAKRSYTGAELLRMDHEQVVRSGSNFLFQWDSTGLPHFHREGVERERHRKMQLTTKKESQGQLQKHICGVQASCA